MLNVAPQKERIPDHLRAMAEQDDKSAASGKTGEQSSIGVGCAPGEERDSAISICAVHSTTVTAAIAEFCEDTVEKQKALTEVLDGWVWLCPSRSRAPGGTWGDTGCKGAHHRSRYSPFRTLVRSAPPNHGEVMR